MLKHDQWADKKDGIEQDKMRWTIWRNNFFLLPEHILCLWKFSNHRLFQGSRLPHQIQMTHSNYRQDEKVWKLWLFMLWFSFFYIICSNAIWEQLQSNETVDCCIFAVRLDALWLMQSQLLNYIREQDRWRCLKFSSFPYSIKWHLFIFVYDALSIPHNAYSSSWLLDNNISSIWKTYFLIQQKYLILDDDKDKKVDWEKINNKINQLKNILRVLSI